MTERKENNLRRNNKPLMEKRRRARINTCLGELKGLILQAMKKENSQFSKLEKADILEMTVKYLRYVQRSQITSAITDPTVVAKYQTGFGECAREVMKCLDSFHGRGQDLQCRLSQHLSQRMYNMNSTQSNILLSTPPMQLIQTMHVEIPSGNVGNLIAAAPTGGMPPHALAQLNFPADNTQRLHLAGSLHDYRKPATLSSPPDSRSPNEDCPTLGVAMKTMPAGTSFGNSDYMLRSSPISPKFRLSPVAFSFGEKSSTVVTQPSTSNVRLNSPLLSNEASSKCELDKRLPNTMQQDISFKRRLVPCSTVSTKPAEENVWRPW